MEQKQPLQQMVLGYLDSYVQKKKKKERKRKKERKEETGSPSYTIHKNKFKVDKRLKYKS